jgi:opacity protein-like surface antigen
MSEFGEDALGLGVTRLGYTVGVGLEWVIATHWTAKIEYDYMNFGSTPILVNLVNPDRAAKLGNLQRLARHG